MPELFSLYIGTTSVNKDVSEDIEKFITDFRKKIKFLQFSDKKFYDKIDNLLVSIDEKQVLLYSRPNEFQRYSKELVNSINQLYKCVDKYYL